jgi:general secretion pathway protein J
MSRQLGFSLIELLIALTIFMIISFASYKILNSSSRIKNTVHNEFKALNDNINVELILEKDFLQVAGGMLTTNKEYQNVFQSPSNDGYKIKILRHGRQAILKEDVNDYLLVAYSLEKNNLVRYFWVNKLQTKNFIRYKQIILSGVTSFDVRFFDDKSKWHKKWPVVTSQPQSALSGTTDNKSKNQQQPLTPKAVEIKIVTEDNGSSLILIPLPSCLNNDDLKILGRSRG